MTIILELEFSAKEKGITLSKPGNCKRSDDCPSSLTCKQLRCVCDNTETQRRNTNTPTRGIDHQELMAKPKFSLSAEGHRLHTKSMMQNGEQKGEQRKIERNRNAQERSPSQFTLQNRSKHTIAKPSRSMKEATDLIRRYSSTRRAPSTYDHKFVGTERTTSKLKMPNELGTDYKRRKWNKSMTARNASFPGAFCDAFSQCGLGAECSMGRCRCIYKQQKLAIVNGSVTCVDIIPSIESDDDTEPHNGALEKRQENSLLSLKRWHASVSPKSFQIMPSKFSVSGGSVWKDQLQNNSSKFVHRTRKDVLQFGFGEDSEKYKLDLMHHFDNKMEMIGRNFLSHLPLL